ncbi:AIR synthase-related protein [Methanoculleus chikugoensis]|uniref:AIR synthase-related protein n=1 Tax=Methanoculleus chikugoensis TaxID=118126 RepID=UPI001FB4DC04|nr:AIR synthase-related protein [Methanoculleus chikugoensis]
MAARREGARRRGDIHAMKDPTRGGFANAINEMTRKSGVGVVIEEEALPSGQASGAPPGCSASTPPSRWRTRARS